MGITTLSVLAIPLLQGSCSRPPRQPPAHRGSRDGGCGLVYKRWVRRGRRVQGLLGHVPHSPLDHHEQRPLPVRGLGQGEAGPGALGCWSACVAVRLALWSLRPPEHTSLVFRLLGFIDWLLIVDLLIQFGSGRLNRHFWNIDWVPGARTTKNSQGLNSVSKPRGSRQQQTHGWPSQVSKGAICFHCFHPALASSEQSRRNPGIWFGRRRNEERGKAGREGGWRGMSREEGGGLGRGRHAAQCSHLVVASGAAGPRGRLCARPGMAGWRCDCLLGILFLDLLCRSSHPPLHEGFGNPCQLCRCPPVAPQPFVLHTPLPNR